MVNNINQESAYLSDGIKDKREKAALKDAFNSLYLPEPKAGEFSQNRLGNLVALSDYGAVIRVEKIDPEGLFAPSTHPFVLQPIGSIINDNYRIELCPGVPKVGITDAEFRSMIPQLIKTGVTSTAQIGDDCGYLAIKTASYPKGIPVIIDRTDILHLPIPINDDEKALPPVDEKIVRAQGALYGRLSRAFNKMIETGTAEVATHFWKKMKSAKDEGLLHSVWERSIELDKLPEGSILKAKANAKPNRQACNLMIAGRNYKKNLHSASLHKGILCP
jgi:hypothetical protein